MYVQRQKEKRTEFVLGVDRSRYRRRSENEGRKQNKRTHRLKLLQQLLPVVDRSGHVARIYNTFVFPFSAVPAWPFSLPLASLSFVDVQRTQCTPAPIKLRKFATRVGNFHLACTRVVTKTVTRGVLAPRVRVSGYDAVTNPARNPPRNRTRSTVTESQRTLRRRTSNEARASQPSMRGNDRASTKGPRRFALTSPRTSP